jgi:hypothetical protein
MRPAFAITAAAILAFAGGLALAVSAQAAPLALTPSTLELRAGPPIELVDEGCGWGWHRRQWQDRWGNWHWAVAFRTVAPTAAGGRGGLIIRTRFGAVPRLIGAGVIHSNRDAHCVALPVSEPRTTANVRIGAENLRP